jgi:hypothetical protein
MDQSKLLETLHQALGQELLDRIKQGEAMPALLGVARQFLKDNGIEGLPAGESPLKGLLETLPEFDRELEDGQCH